MAEGSKSVAKMVDEVIRDNKKLRHIISLLYDSDMGKRLVAAKGLGKIARIRPELIRHRWSRIFYAFDDTMSCWGVAEGLGEIARNMPELRGKIVLMLRKFQKDKASLQGFIWAMCRIGQVDRDMIKDFIPELMGLLDSEDISSLGQAIWALGELKISGINERIKGYLRDKGEVRIYENNRASLKTISEIAEEAIKKLKSRKRGPQVRLWRRPKIK